MKITATIFAIAALLCSCSSSDSFRIEGKIEGGGAQTVELTYYSSGAIRRLTAAASDGKFSMEGESPQPALAYLSVAGSAPLATLVVRNGDDIDCKVDPEKHTWKASGNKATQTLADFTAANEQLLTTGTDEQVNAAVAQYVTTHSKEIGSAALIVTHFRARGHETLADSLISLLPAEARQQGIMQNFMASLATQLSAEANADITTMPLFDARDTTFRYVPQRQTVTLFAFVDSRPESRDSIVRRLRDISGRLSQRRCRVIEVSDALDSASWKRSIASDSATWLQVWAPGTVASSSFRKLSVNRLPFFIVSDSVGHQLYRGSSVTEATSAVDERLSKF